MLPDELANGYPDRNSCGVVNRKDAYLAAQIDRIVTLEFSGWLANYSDNDRPNIPGVVRRHD